MRSFLLLAFAFSCWSASAQDFEILSVEVRETTDAQAEVVVTVLNNRRTASHYSVRADLPGATVLPVVRSTERLAAGASNEVVLQFDASAMERPYDGSVVVMNHRRAEVDRQSFVLPVREAAPAPSPEPIEFVMEVAMSAEAPVEADVSEVTVRITTGADDRAQGTVVFLRFIDAEGAVLTTSNSIVAGSAVLATRDTPGWASGSVHSLTVPLLAPIGPSAISRAVVSASPPPNALGTDQWDVQRIEVEAGGRVLRTLEGPPFHHFSTTSRDRLIQLAPPNARREVNMACLIFHTGNDDKRAQSPVRFQVFSRAGEPLSELFENISLRNATLAGGSSQRVCTFLDDRVRVQDVGSIAIEHESVQTGPFDTADNWTLAGVDVLFQSGDRQGERFDLVDHTAMGAPLHRFTDASRRFVLRLP